MASTSVTWRDVPPSRIDTLEKSVSSIIVLRFLEPLGRPLGLPDFPFLNWCDAGGLAYPTGLWGSEPMLDRDVFCVAVFGVGRVRCLTRGLLD